MISFIIDFEYLYFFILFIIFGSVDFEEDVFNISRIFFLIKVMNLKILNL